jgi:hypothetical protein
VVDAEVVVERVHGSEASAHGDAPGSRPARVTRRRAASPVE